MSNSLQDEERERVLNVLFIAGPQWGQRSPEDIVKSLDDAGYMIVRKPSAAPAVPDLDL